MSPGSANRPSFWALAALSSVLPWWLGCGHPATREECVEIFERNAELELRLQHITDAEEVRKRIAAARERKGDELLQQCVGKRLTDRAMQCVRQAESTEELDECLM